MALLNHYSQAIKMSSNLLGSITVQSYILNLLVQNKSTNTCLIPRMTVTSVVTERAKWIYAARRILCASIPGFSLERVRKQHLNKHLPLTSWSFSRWDKIWDWKFVGSYNTYWNKNMAMYMPLCHDIRSILLMIKSEFLHNPMCIGID